MLFRSDAQPDLNGLCSNPVARTLEGIPVASCEGTAPAKSYQRSVFCRWVRTWVRLLKSQGGKVPSWLLHDDNHTIARMLRAAALVVFAVERKSDMFFSSKMRC